jgi:hypothetical protein
MSSGELCAAKIWLSDGGLNSIAGRWVSCGQYVGHDGKHQTSLICVQNAVYGGKPGYANHRVGSIQWDDELTGKRPK